jgi:hypothetical protein
MGLIDVDQLKDVCTTSSSRGNKSELAGSLRSHDGPLSVDERTAKKTEKDYKNSNFKKNDDEDEENAVITGCNNTKSYHSGVALMAKADEL